MKVGQRRLFKPVESMSADDTFRGSLVFLEQLPFVLGIQCVQLSEDRCGLETIN